MAMDDVLAIILGGGRGTRLFPLTFKRSKPAVPIGGKYRLIDIPISNCLNANLRQIFVLTQFNSESLNKHVAMTYKFDVFSTAFVSVLAAEQTEEGGNWFQGTADAVRQSLRHMRRTQARDILILSGDQLYSMDYAQMLETHRSSGADATVAVIPVAEEQTSGFGILKMDNSGRIVHFDEKPPRERLPGLSSELPGGGSGYLASMGIYFFKREVLETAVANPAAGRLRAPRDPGRGSRASACRPTSTAATGRTSGPSSPTSRPTSRCAIRSRRLISTTRSARSTPTRASCPRRSWKAAPSRARWCPRAASCTAPRSTAPSSASAAASAPGVVIRNSLLIGADHYETLDEMAATEARGVPPVGIGADTVIENAIIDKNARVGRGVRIVNEAGLKNADGDGYFIREGIVIVPKNGCIKNGTVI